MNSPAVSGFEKNLEEGRLLGTKEVLLVCKKEVLFGDRTEYCTRSYHGEGYVTRKPSTPRRPPKGEPYGSKSKEKEDS
jgi:hypothetical protein